MIGLRSALHLHLHLHRCFEGLLIRSRKLTMSSSSSPSPSPSLALQLSGGDAMRNILKATNSWDTCWVEGATPWDLGKVTPVIADLVKRKDLPAAGRALIPGCGTGYDVIALSSPTMHVTGLDISSTAVKRSYEVFGEMDLSHVEFVCADFFTYKPPSCFNLIFDYTFFCALEPKLRPLWASKMAELLTSDGELVTLIFPVSDHEGGPPYAVSFEAYEKVLSAHGFQCMFFKDNALAVNERKGREFLGRWKRVVTKL